MLTTATSFSIDEVSKMLRVPFDRVVELDNIARAQRGLKPKRVRPSRDKVRRYRARQRLGRCILRIEVDEHAVASMLIESGRLSEAEAADRASVERAVAVVVAELAQRWARGNIS